MIKCLLRDVQVSVITFGSILYYTCVVDRIFFLIFWFYSLLGALTLNIIFSLSVLLVFCLEVGAIFLKWSLLSLLFGCVYYIYLYILGVVVIFKVCFNVFLIDAYLIYFWSFYRIVFALVFWDFFPVTNLRLLWTCSKRVHMSLCSYTSIERCLYLTLFQVSMSLFSLKIICLYYGVFPFLEMPPSCVLYYFFLHWQNLQSIFHFFFRSYLELFGIISL